MSSRDLIALRAGAATPPQVTTVTDASDFDTDMAASAVVFDANKQSALNFRAIPDSVGKTYRRVTIEHRPMAEASKLAAAELRLAIALRNKWVFRRSDSPSREKVNGEPLCIDEFDMKDTSPPYNPFKPELPEKSAHKWVWADGIVTVQGIHSDGPPAYSEFCADVETLLIIVNDPETRTLCWRRLALLLERFAMYVLLNADEEQRCQKKTPHRDLYNIFKVDTHVHHSSCFNQKHLLSFIKHRAKTCGNDVVLPNRDDPKGEPLTLAQVFESLNLRAEELSVDLLDVHCGQSTFHRFDRFNLKCMSAMYVTIVLLHLCIRR
jgi:AMP deaminase